MNVTVYRHALLVEKERQLLNLLETKERFDKQNAKIEIPETYRALENKIARLQAEISRILIPEVKP